VSEDIFHKGVLRANDLNDNFESATNVKSLANQTDKQSHLERIRNDEADFPEFKACYSLPELDEKDNQAIADV
jgi:hypothetical protein